MTQELEELEPGAPGLGRRAARGAAWMFGLNMTNRTLGLIRTAIVARLLGPTEIGIFGAAILFMGMVETFTQAGLNSALVQKQSDVEPYLDTAWFLTIVRGTTVGVIMFLGAPLIAQFFRLPDLVLLIRLIAVMEILTGFANIGIVEYTRRLQFKQVYILQAVPTVVDVTVSITAAIILRSALALVLGYVARYVVWVVMTYIVYPRRPKVHFEWSKAKELFRYGRWITGSSWLDFLYSNGDDIFVGRVLGATSLGFYQIAYKYSNLPTTEITRVVQTVAMPAYSRLYGNIERFGKAFLDVLKVTSLASLTLAGIIWVFAGDLTWVILGPKWVAVIPLLRLLAIWGAFESIGETSNALFQAAGHPELGTRLLGIKTVVLVVLIWPLTSRWGLIGTCVAVLIAAAPALWLSLRWVRSTAQISTGALARALVPPALTAGALIAANSLIATSVPEQSLTSIAVRVALTASVCGVAALIAHRAGYDGVSRLAFTVRAAVQR